MHLIPEPPDGSYLAGQIYGDRFSKHSTLHAVPFMDFNILTVYKIGGMTRLQYSRSRVAEGVNTHEIHDYNVHVGYLETDDETEENRRSESERTSRSRTIRVIRELAACNDWELFVTITLSPGKWNRYSPDNLRDVLKENARRWRRLNRKNHDNVPFAYLFVPERHADGATHLHGFVKGIPSALLRKYTMDDVENGPPLPYAICTKVREGQEICCCPEWEEQYGWNTLEPVVDPDRAANYMTSYITKDLCSQPYEHRYFRSRGLARATRIAQFRIPPDPEAEAKYIELAKSLAAITHAGKPLHREFYRPTFIQGKPAEQMTGSSTTIDRNSMTTDDVVKLLETLYPTFYSKEILYENYEYESGA